MAGRDALAASHVAKFALGLIAYTLLVGRTYREAETLAEVLTEIVNPNQLPREPASVRAARAGVTLSPAFDRWFARAANDAADARFGSAGEAIDALATALGLPRPAGALASAPTVPLSAVLAPADVPTILPSSSAAPVGTTTGAPHVARVEPTRTPRARSWKTLGAGLAVVLACGGVAAYLVGKREPPPIVVAPAPSASAPLLRTPEVGLAALASFQAPRGAAIALLDSRSFWDACAQDFRATSTQVGAPARWAAGHVVPRTACAPGDPLCQSF